MDHHTVVASFWRSMSSLKEVHDEPLADNRCNPINSNDETKAASSLNFLSSACNDYFATGKIEEKNRFSTPLSCPQDQVNTNIHTSPVLDQQHFIKNDAHSKFLLELTTVHVHDDAEFKAACGVLELSSLPPSPSMVGCADACIEERADFMSNKSERRGEIASLSALLDKVAEVSVLHQVPDDVVPRVPATMEDETSKCMDGLKGSPSGEEQARHSTEISTTTATTGCCKSFATQTSVATIVHHISPEYCAPYHNEESDMVSYRPFTQPEQSVLDENELNLSTARNSINNDDVPPGTKDLDGAGSFSNANLSGFPLPPGVESSVESNCQVADGRVATVPDAEVRAILAEEGHTSAYINEQSTAVTQFSDHDVVARDGPIVAMETSSNVAVDCEIAAVPETDTTRRAVSVEERQLPLACINEQTMKATQFLDDIVGNRDEPTFALDKAIVVDRKSPSEPEASIEKTKGEVSGVTAIPQGQSPQPMDSDQLKSRWLLHEQPVVETAIRVSRELHLRTPMEAQLAEALQTKVCIPLHCRRDGGRSAATEHGHPNYESDSGATFVPPTTPLAQTFVEMDALETAVGTLRDADVRPANDDLMSKTASLTSLLPLSNDKKRALCTEAPNESSLKRCLSDASPQFERERHKLGLGASATAIQSGMSGDVNSFSSQSGRRQSRHSRFEGLVNRSARINGTQKDNRSRRFSKVIRSTDELALNSLVQEAHADAVASRTERKTQALQDALARYRNEPLKRRAAYTTRCHPRLPLSLATATYEGATGQVATHRSAGHQSAQQYRDPVNNKGLSTVGCVPLESGFLREALPTSTAAVFLKSNFCAADQENLEFVPYFGEDERGTKVSCLYDREALGLFNLESLQKQRIAGPEYQGVDTNNEIDESLKLLYKRLSGIVVEGLELPHSLNLSPTQAKLHRMLADIMGHDVDRIHDRYRKRVIGTSLKVSPTGVNVKQKRGTSTAYADTIDTYHSLLCRRCFTYDCNLHCASDPTPNLKRQGDLALMKDDSGYWNESTNKSFDSLVESPLFTRKRPRNEGELSEFQKSVCERLVIVFRGDAEKISAALDCKKEVVERYIQEQNLSVPQQCLPIKPPDDFCRTRKNTKYYSMSRYNARWLKKVLESQMEQPFFQPCNHESPCSDDGCSCVKNGSFCTKHCLWGPLSRYFFRGCACNGRCTKNNCSCVAANRECDPDLCKACGTCTDPADSPATNQRCLNDNLGMRRHAHLLKAKSGIEDGGWGAFTKFALEKGQFVHEYVGEVISQNEAERRGHTYDLQKRSFLFNLNSDFALDASRKGNITRFINHSSKPNLIAKLRVVNGDYRVGFYAKEDIEAQSELFFNYQYDPTTTRGFHDSLQNAREARS